MMRMLDTQRLRHLQLVNLSSGCAMVIRFVCDSKYMKAFTFAYYIIHFILTRTSWNVKKTYDCFMMHIIYYVRSCLLTWLMLHYSMLMKSHFSICMFVILDCI